MLQQVKILCVDDERNVLKALRRLFMDDDHEIITADSGEEGLQALDEEFPVQIIISDYRMPGMNGVDFLKRVYEKYPDTIRIVLSGYADTAAVVSAINEGQIYKFIPKPWNDDELKVTINKAIETYFLATRNRQLTKELQASNEALQALNENLEDLIEERTAELTFQNKVLERSQHILDALPVGVIGLTIDETIVQCNTIASEITGMDSATLLSRKAAEILPKDLYAYVKGVQKKEYGKEVLEISGRKIRVLGSSLHSEEGQNGLVLVLTPEE